MTKHSRNHRHLLAAITAAAALCALMTGCKKSEEEAPTALVTVQAEHPEQGPLSEHIVADAVLAPIAQAAIAPKITAPVSKFYVQRGAHVKEGDLLATLENKDLKAAALDNQGALTAAQAAYNTETQAQVPEDTLKAQSDLAQAKANLDLQQSIVKARQDLFTQGAIPGRDLDTAKAQLVQAQAAYDAAAKHLDSLNKVSRTAALQQAQGQLNSAKGKYEGAEADVSYSEIRSPINGVVTDRSLFAGETAPAGTPLLTVMDTSTLLAKVHIAQALAQQMKVGDAATVAVPSVDDPVKAKVSLISPALDPGSTTVEVWLQIANKSGALKVGTPVHVSITGHTVPSAIKIPSAAVLTAEDGSKSVMVIGADSTAHRKKVTLGITDGDDVQVLSGLTTADNVITTGAYGMDDGTKVKIGAAGDDDDARPDAGKPADGKDADDK